MKALLLAFLAAVAPVPVTVTPTAERPPVTVYVPPGQPLPIRQWVERPWLVPTWTDACNNSADSLSIWNVAVCGSYPPAKHERMFYRPLPAGGGEMIIGGGDHAVSTPHAGYYDSTGPELVAVNNVTGAWRVVRPFCVPGALQPARYDNATWVYDSRRDRGLVAPGYMNWDPPAWPAGCGAVERYGAFAFDFATGTWRGPDDAAGVPPPPGRGWGGDLGASYGNYLVATDELLRLRNGLGIEALHLATGTWRTTPLRPDQAPPGWNPVIHRAQTALDQRDGVLYWVDMWGDGETGPMYLAATDARTGATRRLRLPPQFRRAEGAADDLYIAWDPGNRVVLIPNNLDMGGGPLGGLVIYEPATGRLTWEATPPGVFGSAWGFDEAVGALVGVGKRQPPYGTFLYKYR